MAIVDAYGREIRKGRPILDEIAIPGVRDRYSSYPSHGLTPERLASILKQADQGDVLRQAELFEEMEEKDAHLGSVVGTRKLAVAGLEWEVAAASDKSEDQKIAAFVKEAIEWIDNWDEALMGLLDAVARGFSVTEIIWELAEGKAWPAELKWRHQKKFTFVQPDVRAGISEVPRLITDAQPVYGEDLPPNKLIVHKYRGRSGITPRAGMLRPCAYMYLFKNYDIKDWVVFNERFAMPMRIGKYAQGTPPEEKEVLRNAVFNLGSDAAAVVSDSTIIELLEGQKYGSINAFEKLATFCDAQISKAVLGHTGSSDSTPGKLGAEHEARDVRQDLLEADAKALAKTITMQLVYPLVGFNFGFDRALPKFNFIYEEGEDLKAKADYLKVLIDAGFDGVPKSYIHESFGIPEAKNGEETIKPVGGGLFRQSLRQAQDAAHRGGGCACGCGGNPPSPPCPRGERMMAMAASGGEPDWIEEYMGRIAPALRDVRKKALDEVEAYLVSQTAPPPFEEFDAAVRGILGEAYEKVDRAAISDAVTEMYKWYKLTDLLGPEIEAVFGGADVRAVDALARFDRFYHSKWIRLPDAERAVTDFLRERFLEGGEGIFGRGDPAAVQELKDLLDQKLIDISEGKVDRIVETSVQRTRNWAHTMQLDDAGIVEMKRFEPVRLCEFCASMHGRVIRVEAAAARVRRLSDMTPEDFEAELKRDDLRPVVGNEEAFVANAVSDPYHPHCRGRWIKA